MQTQLKNLTEQFEDIVGTVRTRIVDTNEYVADTVSPYLNSFGENVNKTAESVSAQVSKTVEALDLPKVDLPKMDLPKVDLPKIDMPDLSNLPSASKIVDSTFSFVADGVEANRKFVAELVDAWTPATEETVETAKTAKKTATKTTKAAAKKTTAKASTAKKAASKTAKAATTK